MYIYVDIDVYTLIYTYIYTYICIFVVITKIAPNATLRAFRLAQRCWYAGATRYHRPAQLHLKRAASDVASLAWRLAASMPIWLLLLLRLPAIGLVDCLPPSRPAFASLGYVFVGLFV